MKNIVIATDFSNEAYNALFYAVNLFDKVACNFYILNAYLVNKSQILSYAGVDSEDEADLAQTSKDNLNEILHRINLDTRNPKHHFTTHSADKSLLEALSEIFEEVKVDLLVLGNGKKRGLNALFYGNQVIKSIHEIKDCPILVVPEEYDFVPPKHIALATDYKKYFHARILFPLISLAGEWNTEVHLVHIKEEDDLNIRQKGNMVTLKSYLAHLKNNTHVMPNFSNKKEVIETFLEELEIDILVMMHYEHSFFVKLIKEPVIENLSLNAKIPMLIIPCDN